MKPDSGAAAAVITVKVFADLRRFAEPETVLEIHESEKVSSLLHRLGIPLHKVTIIFRNGRHADMEDEVKSGDVLSLFPPVGGG